jgi:antitoxin component YwqK of YwqJK toxin-antitoxin module
MFNKKYFPISLVVVLLAACQHANFQEPLAMIQIQDRNGLTETVSAPNRLEKYDKIDFLTPQPYKKILRVYKKDGQNQSKITTYHPNGMVWQYLETKELRAHGAYKEWFQNGQIKIEATVIGGSADVSLGAQSDWLFDGTSKVWNEQGNLIATIPYVKGSLEGTSLYFFPSGALEKEVPYHKHLLEGVVIEYHLNGKIKSKTNYSEGKKKGMSTGYFQNGQIAWEEEYREDLILQGSYYTQRGEMIAEVVDGSGFRAIFNEDSLSLLIQIHQGFAEGGVKQFNPKGDLIGLYHIKNGRKTGEEIIYFSSLESQGSSLQPKISLQWNDNMVHGCVKTWYSNGQMQSQREFSHNKRMGPSLGWYKDGSIMLVEEYDQDRLQKGLYYRKNGIDAISSVVNGSGIATLYDENGVFLRKVNYQKGDPLDPEKE